MSATKSIVALLVGIALDKGFIESIDQPVLDFFPNIKFKRGKNNSTDYNQAFIDYDRTL